MTKSCCARCLSGRMRDLCVKQGRNRRSVTMRSNSRRCGKPAASLRNSTYHPSPRFSTDSPTPNGPIPTGLTIALSKPSSPGRRTYDVPGTSAISADGKSTTATRRRSAITARSCSDAERQALAPAYRWASGRAPAKGPRQTMRMPSHCAP